MTPSMAIGDFLPEVGRSFSLRGIVSDGPDLVGAGFAGALCALAGNCPAIAGLWIDYTLTSPGAPGTELRSETFRRDILPPEFLEQWAAGGPAEWVTQPIIYEDRETLSATLLRSFQILAPVGELNDAFLVHQRVTSTLQTLNYFRALLSAGETLSAQTPGPQFPPRLTSFWANSRTAQDFLQQMRFAGLRSYRNAPGLVIYDRGFTTGTNGLATFEGFDIVHNPGRVTGQDASSASMVRMYDGIIETTVERLIVGFERESREASQTAQSGPGPNSILNTHRVFAAAAAAQISPAVLAGESALARLELLDLPQLAKADIAADLANGYVVVVPERSVELDGTPQEGWWRVSPKDGTTLGVLTEGAVRSSRITRYSTFSSAWLSWPISLFLAAPLSS